MILDYTTYLTETGGYGLNTRTHNRDLFFHEWEKCKYCDNKIETVFSKGLVDIKTLPEVNWHKSETVIKCEGCGWWQHKFHSYLEGEQSFGFKDWQLEVDNAILRTFKINSNKIPVLSLRNYLTSKNDKIFNIHHKKMEELVASVLKEHFDCDVDIVGKSSDGGIDLILVNSDNPIMVQVKRRICKDKTESVKEVRDLLGATLLKNGRNCAFVTTADHFSKEAKEASRNAIAKNIVDTFELYDYKRFFDIMNSLKKTKSFEFKHLLKLKE